MELRTGEIQFWKDLVVAGIRSGRNDASSVQFADNCIVEFRMRKPAPESKPEVLPGIPR